MKVGILWDPVEISEVFHGVLDEFFSGGPQDHAPISEVCYGILNEGFPFRRAPSGLVTILEVSDVVTYEGVVRFRVPSETRQNLRRFRRGRG